MLSVPVWGSLKRLTYHIARVYTGFSERHFCGWKCLVDETEWPDWFKRSGRLKQKSISEHNTLKQNHETSFHSCQQGFLLKWPVCIDVSTRHTSTCLPGNLTLANINPSLGHEAHASLWLLAAVCAEVVYVGWLVCDLKIADAAVSLEIKTRKRDFELLSFTAEGRIPNWTAAHTLPHRYTRLVSAS